MSPATDVADGRGDMGGRIGGRQLHRMTAPGQRDGDGRRHGGLADAALAHGQDDAASGLGEFVDQSRQAVAGRSCRSRSRRRRQRAALGCDQAQGSSPTVPQRQQRRAVAGNAARPAGIAASASAPRRIMASAIGVVGRGDANTPLSASCRLLTPRAASSSRVRSASRSAAASGAADQHHGGLRRVGQTRHGRGIERLLLLQPGQRAEAGGAAGGGVDELAPGRGQGQQAQGVAGGRGVEDDVIELARSPAGSPSSLENSSKAAISTVQAPENCSSMLAMAAAGRMPR